MAAAILVVEDDSAIQTLIGSNLQRSGFFVSTALNAEDALSKMGDALPDMILLDWLLPGMSGLDFLRRVRSDLRTSHIPVIMLTAKGEENDRVIALDNGADDYIVKPFSPRELLARMQAVLRRGCPQATHESISNGKINLSPLERRVMLDGNTVRLGPTEFRLLHFFLTYPDRIHSRSQLLDQVWGEHVFVEERTVDVHIRRLRAALAPIGIDTMIQTVRSRGYRFSEKPKPGAPD